MTSVITSEIINKCKSAITFEEWIEDIEVNMEDCEYEYYKCVFALNNIPYDLKKLTINIREKRNSFGDSVRISRNGDFSTRSYLRVELPDITGMAGEIIKYTFEEFQTKLKIPYNCDLIINKKLIF